MKSRRAPIVLPLALVISAATSLVATGADAGQLAPQTISFTSKTFNPGAGAEYIPIATGGASGNPVVFSIDPSTSANCSLSPVTGLVTFNIPPGQSCIIDANQAGSATYAAALQVQQIFTAPLLPQLVWINTHVPTLRIGMTYQFTAYDKGGGDGSGNPIVFKRDPSSTSGCVVASSGLTIFRAPGGYCALDASQAGGGEYAASGLAGWSFVVRPALDTVNAVGSATMKVVALFYGTSLALQTKLKSQLSALAHAIQRENLKSVTINSYVNLSGATRTDQILSTRLATSAASFLKRRLSILKVTGVAFAVSGRGATSFVVSPSTSLENRRTEIIATK